MTLISDAAIVTGLVSVLALVVLAARRAGRPER